MSGAREATLDRAGDLPLHARLIRDNLTGIERGTLEVHLPEGRNLRIQGAESGVRAVLQVHAPWRLLFRAGTRGAVGFGESYMAGEWGSPDLGALMTLMAENEHQLGAETDARGLMVRLLALYHRCNANTRRGSRRNIAAHYDLGNEFYRLWLDETMTYSGAVFAGPDQPLADAQHAKYRALLDALDVHPGDHLLEIGCGWGGFAEAAARRGARVTGVTLSREQLAYARARLDRAGLGERTELRLQDYRDITGTFDQVVSIEMLEAVGEQYWSTYYDTLAARARPGGGIALHGITIDPTFYEGYRAHPDFIQRYIFPGGMLPTPEHLRREAQRVGFETVAEDGLGLDYARTLAIWHENFLAARQRVLAQGFDRRFIRMWRYYLTYCEGGFRSGRIDLKRLIYRRPA